MNNSSEERLKIAVFIDFDNIAIGVKQSLNRNFDVGTVLEAIKEKGEVITKIAYGDWKRAEDFSRAMTQHAVQMVQRNLTPGGDKNGADIALALDALETAFTRSHINAFVIVGGDSDFIALVEKLKQYDKTVFVVGGRAFTSVILQKNCHEFISYENLVGIQSGSRKIVGKIQLSSPSSLENALPLIRRALKILSDREVSPQLGLLKSTLLQLDSTFSERDYGVGSFRDFIQKLADTGHINLKQVDRSLLVELKDLSEEEPKESPEPIVDQIETPVEITAPVEQIPAEILPQTTPPLPASEASKVLEEQMRDSKIKPHWPMYLRTFKQLLRSLQPPFDERQYGLSSTYDLVRQAHRDGLLHVERNRQGILRIFPGERFPKSFQETPIEETLPITTEEQESTPILQDSDPAMPSLEAAMPVVDFTPESEIPSAMPEILAETPEPISHNEMSDEAPAQPEMQESQEIAEIPEEPATQKPKPRTRRKPATASAPKPGKSYARRPRPARPAKEKNRAGLTETDSK
jgi:uncharacterized LabA/DUF88 family protein